MAQFTEFFLNHWDLFAALAIILALLLGDGLMRRFQGYAEVEPMDAVRLMNHEAAQVVDVRESREVAEGMINGAQHLPLASLGKRLEELPQERERPLIVACRSGSRSGRASAMLVKAGYSQVYNLKGGMSAWQNANLPVSRPGKEKRRKKSK